MIEIVVRKNVRLSSSDHLLLIYVPAEDVICALPDHDRVEQMIYSAMDLERNLNVNVQFIITGELRWMYSEAGMELHQRLLRLRDLCPQSNLVVWLDHTD